MAASVHQKAAYLDIIIEKGTYFSLSMTRFQEDSKTNIQDLSGYTARMVGRASASSTENLFTFTTETGHITLGTAVQNNIVFILDETEVDALSWEEAKYNFYLIDPSGNPERLLTGSIKIVD